jgi:hypothetical protein
MAGLFNSTVLDVAIGLVFVYLLLAIICTAANEWISGLLGTRPKMLKQGLKQLLDNQATTTGRDDVSTFLQAFYKHPLITGMMRGGNHPAYLSARTFSTAVTDIIMAEQAGRAGFADLHAGINSLPPGDVKSALLALLQRSGGDLDAAHKAIEGWYDDAMDRVSGWYKRQVQIWIVCIALVITVLSNADTMQMARRLWTDPVLRSKVVAEAQNRSKKPPPTVEYPDKDDPTNPQVTEGNTVSDSERALLTDLLGWKGQPISAADLAGHLFGWFLTILAISLGAPFWFDLLNKFINIRAAGKSPDEAAKKPAKKKLPPEDQSA